MVQTFKDQLPIHLSSIEHDGHLILDLTPMFNNKAFSSDKKSNTSEMWVRGSGYPIDELPDSGTIIRLGSIPLLFPTYGQKTDNWVIERQSITFDPVLTDKVFMLCAGSGGSYFEDFTIRHIDGMLENKEVYFCDWRDQDPAEGYQARIDCSYHHYSERIDTRPVSIWLQNVVPTVDSKVSVIEFDNNPFAHIFAITLRLVDRNA